MVHSKLFIPLCVAASLGLAFICHSAKAEGIALGVTRVIYPQGEKQVSLPVINSSADNVFLIQSWVSDEQGQKSGDFIVTPPLFVMQAKKENEIRIIHSGPELKTDRESVYYLNVKAIPSVDPGKIKGNNLQIATQSVIKIFVRPKHLEMMPAEAPMKMICKVSGNEINVSNPSPYYVTMINFKVGEVKLPNTMIPPKSNKNLSFTRKGNGKTTFQAINDYGASTSVINCNN